MDPRQSETNLSSNKIIGQSIFQYDPNSAGAVAYGNLAKESIKRFALK